MVLDKIECGKITVDKYFDVRYGSEKYFEYIGREAYRALPKLLYSDDIERFMTFFGNVNEEWKGITLKLRRGDEIYRDAYIRMRKKHNLIGGEQLWDVEFYDIESLVRAYESSCENNNMYRILLGYAEHTYFRYEHDTGEIGVYNVKNGRERVLFAMKLDEWKNEAVYLGHVDRMDKDNFLRMCDDIERGAQDISAEFSTSMYSSTDDIKPCRITGTTITKDGSPLLTVGMIKCIGAFADMGEKDSEDEHLDPLTRLYNKKYIQDKARELIGNGQGGQGTLFIMDIDNFKDISDSFGHMYGDEVLAKVARVVLEVLEDNGIAGRIGGDEFMGIIFNVTDRESIRHILRSIRSRVEYLFGEVHDVNVTCSIGATRFPDDFTTYDDVFKCADKCLYIAKQKGKNRYIIYQEELHGAIHNESSDRTLIEHITARNDFTVSVVKNAIGMLYERGRDAIPDVLRMVAEKARFDRAAVYYGPEYKLAYYYGAECSDTAFWADSQTYLEHFDNDGIHLASSLFKVEGAEREIFERFKMQHTECCIQVILGDKEHVYGYTSFECCNKGKRYEESLGNSINYISKLIYEVMRREG